MNFFVSISANYLFLSCNVVFDIHGQAIRGPTLAITIRHLINLTGLHCDQLRSRGKWFVPYWLWTAIALTRLHSTITGTRKTFSFFFHWKTIYRSLFIPHVADIKNIAANFGKEIIIISMSRAKDWLQGEILGWVNNNCVFIALL